MGYQGYQASLGEKKLIGILREIYKKPTLLIMDEPIASLDFTKRSFIYNLLYQSKAKTTLLVVTHDKCISLKTDKIINLYI